MDGGAGKHRRPLYALFSVEHAAHVFPCSDGERIRPCLAVGRIGLAMGEDLALWPTGMGSLGNAGCCWGRRGMASAFCRTLRRVDRLGLRCRRGRLHLRNVAITMAKGSHSGDCSANFIFFSAFVGAGLARAGNPFVSYVGRAGHPVVPQWLDIEWCSSFHVFAESLPH